MQLYFHDRDRDLLILSADGGLNASTAPEMLAELERLIESGTRKIIVDCANLDYISSYGIGVLIRLHKKLAKSGGDVKFSSIRSTVVQILHVARIDRLFEIYPDIDQARLAFRPAGE